VVVGDDVVLAPLGEADEDAVLAAGDQVVSHDVVAVVAEVVEIAVRDARAFRAAFDAVGELFGSVTRRSPEPSIPIT
jgi:hypothetical protein